MAYKVCEFLESGPCQTDDGKYICKVQKSKCGDVYVPKSKCMDSDYIESCEYYKKAKK